MSLFRDLRNIQSLTEREADIRDFIMEHPESVVSLSCRELGAATYTSAATVTRFCQKLGFKGYPAFKLEFSSEIAGGHALEVGKQVQLCSRENLLSLLEKVDQVEKRALEATRDALSLSQLLRVQKLLLNHTHIDIYAYDINVPLADYSRSLLVHAGVSAAVYGHSNEQVLHALNVGPDHLALILSHTGESKRLIELAKVLGERNIFRLIITSGKETSLGKLADEMLFAPSAVGMNKMWESAFSTGAKFLIDLIFAITFSAHFDRNLSLNNAYETIGDSSFWQLTKTFTELDNDI